MASGFHHPLSGELFPLQEGREIGRVSLRSSTQVIDESLMSPRGEGDDAEGSGPFMGLAVSERKLRILFAFAFLSLAMVTVRAFDMQVARGDVYRRRAEENRSRIAWVPSERGVMYDRNGTALVRNVPSLSVSLTPDDLPKEIAERRVVISRVADILGLAPLEIEQRLAEFAKYPSLPVAVASDLTHGQAVLVSIESAKSSGVSLVIGRRREYAVSAGGSSLSHILGYQGRVTSSDLSAKGGTASRSGSRTTGGNGDPDASYSPSDVIGKTGLERSYENVLRGRYAKQTVEVDARGKQKQVIAEEAGMPGQSLVLSIDADLQKKAEAIFQERLKQAGQQRGSLIIMSAKTGDILAMVSSPAFDNNLFAKGISTEDYKKLNEDPNNPMFPRAIAGSLPAGSPFKLVVAAAALDEGLITAKTSVLSVGGIRVGKWFFPDWKAGGHGVTSVTKAIAESVNTFFYIIGGGLDDKPGLGVDRITAYAKRFGFGSRLGIDLAGEGAGFMPSKEWKERVKDERWYVGDTYHIAIGQGDVLVTPLQIAAMTSVFANDGKLVRPRVVNATVSTDGTRVVKEPEMIEKRVVSPAAVQAVRQGMRAAVTSGSARSLADLPVAVAAKTGTAQWSSTQPTHAWFTAFAPYDDPEIVVTVVIENGGEGSKTAAPVAKDVFAWYFGQQ